MFCLIGLFLDRTNTDIREVECSASLFLCPVVWAGYLMGYFTKLKQVLSILVIMAVISVSLIEIWTLIKGFLADG